MKKTWDFFTRSNFVSQAIIILLVVIYWVPFLCFFAAHVILWGLHSMIFGSHDHSDLGQRMANIPFLLPPTIGAVAAIFWAYYLARALFS